MASIYKRQKGKTYNVIYDVTDEDGKRKQVWESGFSFKEAKARKLEIESQQENGSFAEPNNAKMVTDTYAKIPGKNRKKMVKALEKNFYRDCGGEEAQQERPVSKLEEANNLILLQKLAADPQAMQTLLKLLQTP